jgi:DNA-binding beta-propeller fold protein YncE
VAIDLKNQRMFVSDLGNNRVQVFSLRPGMEGSLLGTFGQLGSEPGNFSKPGTLEMDQAGNLYVLDVGNSRVQVFDPDLSFVEAWGEPGTGPGQFNLPSAISFSPDEQRLYILDSYNYRVQVFDPSGQFLFDFGGPGAGQSQFIWPYGMAVDDQGFVYVSDAGGQKIKKFTADGNFVASFGDFGSGPGQFYKPKGIAMTDSGILYVIDFGNHRGQMLTKSGAFVAEWGIGELSGSQAVQASTPLFKPALGAMGALFLIGGFLGLKRINRLRKA